ncbi:MAG: hypothetical protein WA532_04205 [Candidatus Korobacteraceae bacterium]
MASQVRLIRENQRELVFAYPYHVASWFAALIGGGLFYMVCRSMVGGPTFLRWLVAIFGLVIALAGIAGSIHTDRLTLDLMTRTYIRRKGYLRKITAQSGSFDDIQGVALQIEYETSSHGQPIPYWALRLVLRHADSISIASFGNEQAAYARLASIAKALHVPAIDRTGDQETTTQPENLDQPLVMKAPRRASAPRLSVNGIPPLPSGSRIRLAGAAPQRSIVLPPFGFSVGIALVFGWFALITFGMGFAGLRDKLGGRHPLTPWGLIAITLLLGIFFLSLIPIVSYSCSVVVETATNFSFGLQLLGWRFALKPIAKTAIEEILVKPAPNLGTSLRPDLKGFPQSVPGKHEVCLRSGARAVRIGGNLSREEQDWLRQALLSMIDGA